GGRRARRTDTPCKLRVQTPGGGTRRATVAVAPPLTRMFTPAAPARRRNSSNGCSPCATTSACWRRNTIPRCSVNSATFPRVFLTRHSSAQRRRLTRPGRENRAFFLCNRRLHFDQHVG